MTRSQLRRWLEVTTLTNPVERGQAAALQIMLLLVGTFGALLIVLLVITLLVTPGDNLALAVQTLGLALFLISCALGAVALLRRGHFQAAVLLATVSFTVLHSITVLTLGLANTEVLLVYLLPLTLAGLLSSRRALPVVLAIACGAVWLATLTSPAAAIPPIGTVQLGDPSPPIIAALNFTLIITIAAVFFRIFGNVLAEALTRALAREHELDELRRGLEQTVGAQTAELRAALSEVEARVAAQAKLLAENSEQREVIREMSVPVLPVSDTTLVMPLIGALDSHRLQEAQEQALSHVGRTRARRLILDITGVPVVDTQVAQGLVHLVQSLRLLGAEAVLVGIRPEVAQTIVGLGLSLETIQTASDIQSVLQTSSSHHRH